MDIQHKPATFSARIAPAAGLDVLSRHEVARLRDAGGGGLHELLRRCALAVLTQGTASDDARALLERYPDFDIQILQQDRGVKLELIHAPADAEGFLRVRGDFSAFTGAGFGFPGAAEDLRAAGVLLTLGVPALRDRTRFSVVAKWKRPL